MIYLRLSKRDDARLTRASERLGKSKAAFARDAIEVQLPELEQQAAKNAQNPETDILKRH